MSEASALMQIPTLTPSQRRLIEMISRSDWPGITLYGIIAIVCGGVLSLGIAVGHCIQLYRMTDTNQLKPDFITFLSEAWLALLIGSVALVSALLIWVVRSYGLLIRKLGDNYGGKVPPYPPASGL